MLLTDVITVCVRARDGVTFASNTIRVTSFGCISPEMFVFDAHYTVSGVFGHKLSF